MAGVVCDFQTVKISKIPQCRALGLYITVNYSIKSHPLLAEFLLITTKFNSRREQSHQANILKKQPNFPRFFSRFDGPGESTLEKDC